MAKSYIGNNTLSSLMKNVLSVAPSSVITEDETKELWDSLDKPVIEVAPDGELDNWDYTLDETNKIITLNQYTNTTATDVIVYGKYQLDGVEYDTKIRSNDNYYRTAYMFIGKSEIETITFKEGIDTSDVTDMSNMFCGCSVLTTINGLEHLDTSKVTTMANMFSGCALTSLDLTSFDTSKVTNMSTMFNECMALTEIKVTTGKWVIADGCNTTNMFDSCGVSDVTYIDAA